MSLPYTFVPELPRSQIRRTILEALCAINPANSPAGSTQNYSTNVAGVHDSWGTEDEIPDLPAIEFRFDSDQVDATQAQRIRILQEFEIKLVVGGPSDEIAAQLDRLRDDVIAALYANSRFGGYGYAVEFLSGQEIPRTELLRRVYTMRWMMRYHRRRVLEANNVTPVP